MHFKKLALVSVLVAAACGSPCRDQKVAAAALGGPLGIIFAAAWQCSDDSTPPPQPVSAVATAGLAVPEQPDMASADLAESVPDLATPPPPPAPDADLDGVPDGQDKCPSTPQGQAPDPARSGCPKPRAYQVRLPAAAFAAAGPLTVADGVVTSKAYYDWAASKFANGSLSAVVFFENASANASNAVSFELQGTADFSAPISTADSCKPWKGEREDVTDPNPKTGNPNDTVCVPRRIDLCPVDLASKTSQLLGEAQCADGIQRGTGFRSKANAPIRLAAAVPNADWASAEPKPTAGIEIQVLFSGNLKLAGWEVVASVTETLR